MDNTIKTENGIFTINYVPKHIKIESMMNEIIF
jgi:hypothetical protein